MSSSIQSVGEFSTTTTAQGDGTVRVEFRTGVSTYIGYFIPTFTGTVMKPGEIAASMRVNDVVRWEANQASNVEFTNYFKFTVQRSTTVADAYNLYIEGENMSGLYATYTSEFINSMFITSNSVRVFGTTKFKIEPEYAKLTIAERPSYSYRGSTEGPLISTDQTFIGKFWEHENPTFEEVVALRATVDFNVLAAESKIASFAQIVVSDISDGEKLSYPLQYESAEAAYTFSKDDMTSDTSNTWVDFPVLSQSANLWRRPLISNTYAPDAYGDGTDNDLSPEMTRTIAINVSVGKASDVIQFRRRFYGNYPSSGITTAYTDAITGSPAASQDYAQATNRLPLTVNGKRYFAASSQFFLIGTVTLTHRLFPGEYLECSFLGDSQNVSGASNNRNVKFVNGALPWTDAAELDPAQDSQTIGARTAVNTLTSSVVNAQSSGTWYVWIKVTRSDLQTAGGVRQVSTDANSNIVADGMHLNFTLNYGKTANQQIAVQLGGSDNDFGMFAYPTDGTLRVVGPAGAGRNSYSFDYGMIYQPDNTKDLEVAQFVQIPAAQEGVVQTTRTFSLADLHIRTGLNASAVESLSGYFTVKKWVGDESDATTVTPGEEAENYQVVYTEDIEDGYRVQGSSTGSYVNYTRFEYNTQNVSCYATRFLYHVPSTQTKGTVNFRITFNDASIPDSTKSVLVSVHFVDSAAKWQRKYANENPSTSAATPYLYTDVISKYESEKEGNHTFAGSFMLDLKQPDEIPAVPVRFVLAEFNSGFGNDTTLLREHSAWNPSEFTAHNNLNFAFTFGDAPTEGTVEQEVSFAASTPESGVDVTKDVKFFANDSNKQPSGRLFLQSVIYGLADAEIYLVNNIVDPRPSGLVLKEDSSIPGYMDLQVEWLDGNVPNSDGAYKFALTATLGNDTYNLYFSSSCKVADMEAWLEGLPDLAYSQEESSLGPMWSELRDAKLTSNWTPVQNARPITYTLYTAKVGERMSLSSDNVLTTTDASSASFTMNVATQYAPFLRRPLEDGALQVITRNRQYMYTTRAVQYTTRNAGAAGLNSAHLGGFHYDVFPPPTESESDYIVEMGEIDQDAT